MDALDARARSIWGRSAFIAAASGAAIALAIEGLGMLDAASRNWLLAIGIVMFVAWNLGASAILGLTAVLSAVGWVREARRGRAAEFAPANRVNFAIVFLAWALGDLLGFRFGLSIVEGDWALVEAVAIWGLALLLVAAVALRWHLRDPTVDA